MRQTLNSGLASMGLSLSPAQVDLFCRFGQALLEKNQVMNLTAITQPQAVAQLHFLDSIAVLTQLSLKDRSLIDVGCGAGFPGVPLKIAEPSVQLTLLDSLTKRVAWLQELLPQLGIDAQCVSGRAEDFVKDHRESYDVATSRAVARLNILSELCLPYVKTGGVFLAMKGQLADVELDEASRGIRLLGGKVERVYEYEVAGAVHRAVVIRKEKPTPAGYPRAFAKIKKTPL